MIVLPKGDVSARQNLQRSLEGDSEKAREKIRQGAAGRIIAKLRRNRAKEHFPDAQTVPTPALGIAYGDHCRTGAAPSQGELLVCGFVSGLEKVPIVEGRRNSPTNLGDVVPRS